MLTLFCCFLWGKRELALNVLVFPPRGITVTTSNCLGLAIYIQRMPTDTCLQLDVSKGVQYLFWPLRLADIIVRWNPEGRCFTHCRKLKEKSGRHEGDFKTKTKCCYLCLKITVVAIYLFFKYAKYFFSFLFFLQSNS